MWSRKYSNNWQQEHAFLFNDINRLTFPLFQTPEHFHLDERERVDEYEDDSTWQEKVQ